MARVERVYRRLPGRGSTLTSYVRLYEGPDHLLQVFSTGYSENYKRFFHRDIQAVLIQKNSWQVAWTAILAALAAVFGLPGAIVAAAGSEVGSLILFGLVAVFLALLAGNLLLGPTCHCYIRTVVQVEKLPTLRRVRHAQKFLARLRPLVAQAQGPLAPDEWARRAAEADQIASFEAAHPPVVQSGYAASPAAATPGPPAS